MILMSGYTVAEPHSFASVSGSPLLAPIESQPQEAKCVKETWR
jgi:hypothetical protein